MDIQSFAQLLEQTDGNPNLQQRVAEILVSDIISQLDVIDPTDEAEDFLSMVQENIDSRFLAYLIGVSDLDEYARDLVDELAEELED